MKQTNTVTASKSKRHRLVYWKNKPTKHRISKNKKKNNKTKQQQQQQQQHNQH
jgi:hypothetical protein